MGVRGRPLARDVSVAKRGRRWGATLMGIAAGMVAKRFFARLQAAKIHVKIGRMQWESDATCGMSGAWVAYSCQTPTAYRRYRALRG